MSPGFADMLNLDSEGDGKTGSEYIELSEDAEVLEKSLDICKEDVDDIPRIGGKANAPGLQRLGRLYQIQDGTRTSFD